MRLLATEVERLATARRVSPLVIVAVLGAYAAWGMLVWVWVFQNWIFGVVHATHGLVNPTLIASSFSTVAAIVLICGVGKLRARDLGLSGRGLAIGAAATAAMWLGMQLVFVIAAVAGGDGVHRSAQLTNDHLGELIGQLFGNAPNEELVMRGFLFVQLALLARRFAPPRASWIIAALVESAVFAATHIPHRWAMYDLHGTELLGSLAFVMWNGLMFTLVYVRTGHLEVAIGVHALFNEQLPLVDAPIAAKTTMIAIQAVVIIAWPWLCRATGVSGSRLRACCAASRRRAGRRRDRP